MCQNDLHYETVLHRASACDFQLNPNCTIIQSVMKTVITIIILCISLSESGVCPRERNPLIHSWTSTMITMITLTQVMSFNQMRTEGTKEDPSIQFLQKKEKRKRNPGGIGNSKEAKATSGERRQTDGEGL